MLGIVSLASWEDGPVEAAPARAARVADLVDICVAVLEAPASSRTHDALAAVDELAAATTTTNPTTNPTTEPTTGA